jgi:hypothetical protein
MKIKNDGGIEAVIEISKPTQLSRTVVLYEHPDASSHQPWEYTFLGMKNVIFLQN